MDLSSFLLLHFLDLFLMDLNLSFLELFVDLKFFEVNVCHSSVYEVELMTIFSLSDDDVTWEEQKHVQVVNNEAYLNRGTLLQHLNIGNHARVQMI